jgi:membrane-bound lytic murein transglycosylase A
MKNLPVRRFFILILFLVLNGCATAPLDRIDPHQKPNLLDDNNLQGLLTAAVRHLHYLNTQDQTRSVTLGSDSYTVAWIRQSMESFIDVLKQDPTPEELARVIAENYTLYQAGGRDNLPRGEMLITGYYEPSLMGSLSREAPFLYPLYSPPDTLVQLRDPTSNKRIFKRRDQNGKVLPYWTRREIEEDKRAEGFELVYLNNPVDAFILQVQGSGKIQLRDGTVRSIHYAASNGLEYFSIGKLLVDSGKMSLEEVSIPTIRQYLKDHPEEQDAILNHNIKFIFFNWAADGDPAGSLGEPLVGGRSIAVDPSVLPQTTLAFLQSRKPVLDENGKLIGWLPLHRFVFPQDTGSAIKGAGRADLYWGNGHYAQLAAGSMKEKGQLFFLVKNTFEKQVE